MSSPESRRKRLSFARRPRTGGPLIREGQTQEALRIFQATAKRFLRQWPTDLGIARAQSALGNTSAALKHAKAALTFAPDDPSRDNVRRLIARLEKGEVINR